MNLKNNFSKMMGPKIMIFDKNIFKCYLRTFFPVVSSYVKWSKTSFSTELPQIHIALVKFVNEFSMSKLCCKNKILQKYLPNENLPASRNKIIFMSQHTFPVALKTVLSQQDCLKNFQAALLTVKTTFSQSLD